MPVPVGLRILILMVLCVAAGAEEPVEYFEKQVRPLLAEHCYACHSNRTKTPFAGLRLDSRAGMMKGGDAGPVIVPGDAEQSRLLRAVRGQLPQPMPPAGKLRDEQIAALARWVEIGAPWPEEAASAVPENNGFDLEKRKREHWAWQPLRRNLPPGVSVDVFLKEKLDAKAIRPAAPAARSALIRRLYFDLTGLPPGPEEIAAFVADRSEGAYAALVDRLLSSPRYGERWARHWMDWVRYAESHGSEGDPDTLMAWRYRDYLIRALNADVPYHQLVKEHIAGDLLVNPRINTGEKINESLLGVANLRMVEHGFQPVDPWEDRVKWTDNQIEVFSKAFQGLTISCARCHDHKFDAISQRDFYALFGVFAGARPTQVSIDTPEVLEKNRPELARLKERIREKVGEAWLAAARGFHERLETGGIDKAVLEEAAGKKEHPLHVWAKLGRETGAAFAAGWRELAEYWKRELDARREYNRGHFRTVWDLRTDRWPIHHGTGVTGKASPPGEFFIPISGERVVNGVYPGGVYTHLISTKHAGVIQSQRFKIESDYLSLRMLGGNFNFAQLIIENYSVPRGGIYQLRHSGKKDQMGWDTWDLTYWKGFTAYMEFATKDEATHIFPDDELAKMRPVPRPAADGRSYFGAQQVVFHNGKEPPKDEIAPIGTLLEGDSPASAAELAARIAERLEAAVLAWPDGSLTEQQAAFLDVFVRANLLPATLDRLEAAKALVSEYRKLEAEIPVAQRAPGVIDEGGPDQALLVRGNHKNPGPAVPRRYLEALGSQSYGEPRLARLRLAEEVTSAENPLLARVLVNRVWHYLFRRGIVRTVDNFGKLGEPPTHPELLDWLATQFVREGWSLKKLIRMLVTTEAYQRGSVPNAEAARLDPSNTLFHHVPLRRLEAEEIRDSILSVTGELNAEMYGPSVPVYYAHETGQTKGDRPKGPLDGNGRRSVYLEIRRNATNPFLEVFDVPKPATTRGARDVTNVPAQSLAMLNSQFVLEQARRWAGRLAADGAWSAGDRVERILFRALGRKPAPEERDQSLTFLGELSRERGSAGNVMADARVWQDFVHAVFNLKEFLYVP
jgi:hypothetical protein